MLFNSIHFVLFFILVSGLYFLFPYRFRWALLLGASCYFYMVFKPIYILILFFTIVIDYFAGIYIDKAEGKARKNLLLISLVANVGILAVFKYFNFFNANLSQFLEVFGKPNPIPFLEILLPIGLSFHTFQAMSYTIEVYRGNQKPERHFGIYALYVMFYPQLVAGPIERPQNVIHQFHEKFDFDYTRVVSGLRKMAWGMFKKIVIADRLAVYVNQVYGKPEDYSGFPLIMATVLFAFQIYCDFSGYSDIALGSARVMGFDLMKNFNRPYFSKSISEFWRRWHISLSTWFRDYLYIPMGGNKVGKGRWYFNLFFTFLISGFWHGASWNYVIWGSLHGFYLIMALLFVPYINPALAKIGLSEKSSVGAWFHCIWTFALACFAWVFFRATSFHDAVYITSNFFTDFGLSIKAIIFNTNNLRNHFLYVEITKFHLFLGLAGIFILLFVEWLQRKGSMQQLLLKKTSFVRWSIYLAFGWYFLLFGMFGSNQQFTYFQF
jgi:D-alanyl-lipoteichoic acid acyltransferase DltB (MBOAT superfamily)